MKTCLVLGATGFIGGHIAREAVARGWRVRALRRNPDFVGAIGDVEVEWISGNLDDRSALIEAMRGCSVIFHSAGAYPHGTRQIDRDVQIALAQTRNVIEAARLAQPDRLIYTSSFTTMLSDGAPMPLVAHTTGAPPGRVARNDARPRLVDSDRPWVSVTVAMAADRPGSPLRRATVVPGARSAVPKPRW